MSSPLAKTYLKPAKPDEARKEETGAGRTSKRKQDDESTCPASKRKAPLGPSADTTTAAGDNVGLQPSTGPPLTPANDPVPPPKEPMPTSLPASATQQPSVEVKQEGAPFDPPFPATPFTMRTVKVEPNDPHHATLMSNKPNAEEEEADMMAEGDMVPLPLMPAASSPRNEARMIPIGSADDIVRQPQGLQLVPIFLKNENKTVFSTQNGQGRPTEVVMCGTVMEWSHTGPLGNLGTRFVDFSAHEDAKYVLHMKLENPPGVGISDGAYNASVRELYNFSEKSKRTVWDTLVQLGKDPKTARTGKSSIYEKVKSIAGEDATDDEMFPTFARMTQAGARVANPDAPPEEDPTIVRLSRSVFQSTKYASPLPEGVGDDVLGPEGSPFRRYVEEQLAKKLVYNPLPISAGSACLRVPTYVRENGNSKLVPPGDFTLDNPEVALTATRIHKGDVVLAHAKLRFYESGSNHGFLWSLTSISLVKRTNIPYRRSASDYFADARALPPCELAGL